MGKVEYHPEGSPTGMEIVSGSNLETKPELRKRSEFHLGFKDSERAWISLSGNEADTAWKNYKMALDPSGEMLRSEESPDTLEK